MSQQLARPKIWANLLQEVVRTDLCVSCGTCSAVCPVNSITMVEDKPNLVSVCIACGMCYNSCPRTNFSEAETEERFFGRLRGENEEKYLGVYKALYSARSRDEAVLSRCQDGGTATSIAMQFMKDETEAHAISAGLSTPYQPLGIEVDEAGVCTIAAGLEANWHPKPVVATSVEDLLKCAGTKYTPSQNMLGLYSAVWAYRKRRAVLIGTPCQMRAWRRTITPSFSDIRLGGKVELAIGLFCMESFDYKSLMEHLQKEGVDLTKVKRFEISGGRFQALDEGKQVLYKAAIRKMANLVRPCCHHCTDFASEFADISVGSVGSSEGWNTVIVRTERGEKALDRAAKAGILEVKPLEGDKKGLGAVVKLAMEKREKAERIVASPEKSA
jgi:coenzyme F420 hydrogenase subunit beta